VETINQQNKTSIPSLYQSYDLREWAEMFIHACRSRNLAIGTIEFYTKKLKAFIEFCADIAITDINEIRPETIRHFLIYLEERHHKPGGIHCYYRVLKTFLLWYEVETEPDNWANPIERVRAPIVPLEPLDPVSVDTVREMIRTCLPEQLTAARDKASLLFLLDTGVRLAEFLGLNRQDVNLITGTVQIRRGKGRKPRNVYMGDKARIALKRYLRDRNDHNPALWIGTSGERLSATAVRSMLRRRSDRAGVPVPSPHDFRRAFAIERWRAGTDIVTLSKLMGHTSLQILNRYLKQVGEDLEQAARETSPVDLNF
jgi:integrase/recombinase XerC